MRRQREDQEQCRWRNTKEALGALAEILIFVVFVFGMAMLPGFLTDSASTVGARTMRIAAHAGGGR